MVYGIIAACVFLGAALWDRRRTRRILEGLSRMLDDAM